MERAQRRQFLISKAWIQAVVLVVLCGFFVLDLLAYRTYMAHPPVPARVVDQNGSVLFTGRDISQGQRVFLHNGLMEYGSVFGHGAYLGPDYTADYLRREADLARDTYGGPPSDSAAQKTIEDMRTNRYDPKTRTLTFSAAEAAAFRKLVPLLQPVLLRPDERARPAPRRDHEPDAAPPANRILRLDGLDRGGEATRPRLLIHEQLALRATRRQQADRKRDRLVRAVADRAARRDRSAVWGVRTLGRPARLARARAGDPLLPLPRRRRLDSGPARDRVALLRHGRADCS